MRQVTLAGGITANMRSHEYDTWHESTCQVAVLNQAQDTGEISKWPYWIWLDTVRLINQDLDRRYGSGSSSNRPWSNYRPRFTRWFS